MQFTDNFPVFIKKYLVKIIKYKNIVSKKK